jgi:hypothetical protein
MARDAVKANALMREYFMTPVPIISQIIQTSMPRF